MASNKSTGVTMHIKPVEVSQQLQGGEKFIKWDEVRVFLMLRLVLMSSASKSINVKGHFRHKSASFQVTKSKKQKEMEFRDKLVFCIPILRHRYRPCNGKTIIRQLQ